MSVGGFSVGRVNYSWSPPAHFWFRAPPRHMPKFLFVPRQRMYFKNGPRTRGGVGLSEEAPHLLHRNSARVCPHSHNVQVRATMHYEPKRKHRPQQSHCCVRIRFRGNVLTRWCLALDAFGTLLLTTLFRLLGFMSKCRNIKFAFV
jgi:hypothetical protein